MSITTLFKCLWKHFKRSFSLRRHDPNVLIDGARELDVTPQKKPQRSEQQQTCCALLLLVSYDWTIAARGGAQQSLNYKFTALLIVTAEELQLLSSQTVYIMDIFSLDDS